MKYIAHKRFKGQAICGTVNIPAMTECHTENEFIVLDGKKICVVFSENAHTYFAINEDGGGIQRGRLTSEIIKMLVNKDDKYDARWEKVWGDELCLRYKRSEHPDHWLWNHNFYNADIKDLEYIKSIITI